MSVATKMKAFIRFLTSPVRRLRARINPEQKLGEMNRLAAAKNPAGAIRFASHNIRALQPYSDDEDFAFFFEAAGDSLFPQAAAQVVTPRPVPPVAPPVTGPVNQTGTGTPPTQQNPGPQNPVGQNPGTTSPATAAQPAAPARTNPIGRIPQHTHRFRIPAAVLRLWDGAPDYDKAKQFARVAADTQPGSRIQQSSLNLLGKSLAHMLQTEGHEATLRAALRLMRKKHIKNNPSVFEAVATHALRVAAGNGLGNDKVRLQLRRDLMRAIPADHALNADALGLVLDDAQALCHQAPLRSTKLALEMYDDAARGTPEHEAARDAFRHFAAAAGTLSPLSTRLYMWRLRRTHADGEELFELANQASREARTPARTPAQALRAQSALFPA